MIYKIAEEWVDSSWIEEIELEQDDEDIIMHLLAGRKYKIIGPGEDVLDDWIAAPSKGKYFHNYIKDYYEIVRLMDESVTMNEAPEIGRKDHLTYKEGKVKDVVTKITVVLEKDESGAFTRLANRYKKLDKQIAQLTNMRENLNDIVRRKIEVLFNAEDETLNRIVETVSMTANLARKAEGKDVFKQADYIKRLEKSAARKGWVAEDPIEKYIRELEEAVGMNQTALDKIKAYFTKFQEPPKKKAALRVKTKENVTEDIDTEAQAAANEIMAINDVTDEILDGIRMGD